MTASLSLIECNEYENETFCYKHTLLINLTTDVCLRERYDCLLIDIYVNNTGKRYE